MANIPIEVNTGETKTITFHTAGTFNTEDIVFSISAAGGDANTTMTVSTLINDRYGINDVCLSLPAVIGCHGIEREITPALTDKEVEKLQKSAKALRDVLDQLEF